MFKIVQNPTFTHTVKARVPVDGGHRDEPFKVTYAVIPSSEVAAFDLATEQGTRDFLQAAVVRMDEIADEAGGTLPYNDELRDRVFDLPYARAAILQGYLNAVAKAAAGN